MKKYVPLIRAFVATTLLICLLPLAQAQWSWKDKDGRRIFSDQPPPSGVPDKDIFQRPPGSRAAQTATASEAATSTPASTATTAGAPKISGKDAELEKKKKEADAKQAAKQKAEDAQIAAAKKDNCERAKRAQSTFDSGVRVATTNANGEREFMSDAARAAETKRLKDIMAKDCS
jgi:Domain of unknown function (DUF4124)